MATSNNALRVADLDFFSIKENIKSYLRSQAQFTDFDYEGSGMSVLLDILAYNTYYNSFYLNMAANEAFLDTAQIRQNILSHAKTINYVPSSAQGAKTTLTVTVTPSLAESNTINYLVIDKYSRLLGQDVDGINYPFVTLNSNTAYKIDGSFVFSNVDIKQGETVTLQFPVYANNTSRRYQIPSANVDVSTISVSVQESKNNTYTEVYSVSTDITEVSNKSKVFFIEEDDTLTYTIYFGDDVIGKKPVPGNIINVTYLDTAGAVSNSISKFTFTTSLFDGKFKDNVKVVSHAPAIGGIDKESVETIRYRAPHYYTAQNRAVTTNDYESLVLKDYDNIDAVSIWGGEDHVPVTYGKVFLSIKTKGYYALSNFEKERIKNELIRNRNVLTVIPEIIDPDYTFIQVRGQVRYNPSKTTKTSEELLSIVKNAVAQYNTDELNGFKSVFKKSKLQKYIEECDAAITTSDLKIFLQKRLQVAINIPKIYVIDFFSPLEKGTFNQKFNTYPQLRVLDQNLITRDVQFEEATEILTGIDSIELVSKGMNYSSVPQIVIKGDGSGATAEATIFGGRIDSIRITNPGKNYTQANIFIVGGDGMYASAVAKMQCKVSRVRSFYYNPETREKVEFNPNAGSIDYDTGRVTLASAPLSVTKVVDNSFYDTNTVSINAISASDTIYPLRNRILSIDMFNGQSVLLDMIPES